MAVAGASAGWSGRTWSEIGGFDHRQLPRSCYCRFDRPREAARFGEQAWLISKRRADASRGLPGVAEGFHAGACVETGAAVPQRTSLCPRCERAWMAVVDYQQATSLFANISLSSCP
jgi:hypothetical protein